MSWVRKYSDGMHRSSEGKAASKERGIFLLELLILMGGLAVILGVAVPVFSSWRDARLLDSAAAETAAIIRQVQAEARNNETAYASAVDGKKKITFTTKNGRVYYYASRSTRNTQPKGYLPAGVFLASSNAIEMEFRRNGFPGSGNASYTVTLVTKDRSHARKVTVAAYTGRVRVEEAW